MQTKRFNYRRLLLASAVTGLYAHGAGQALAADIKVEVTGSNIKRIEGEGALPVQVIGREEIAKSGATNAMEIMNLISANNSAGNVSVGNVIGATTFSNQTASLRGLGGNFTLVLVNGKRLGTFAGGISGAEGVNLATIPFAAIERVEVLKDGASAIYGSDAVGGVINFIMRQDFTGVDATAWYGTPTRSGGGDQYQLSATAGYGDLAKDKWNAFLAVNYSEQKSLDQFDRSFSNTNYNAPAGLNTTSGQTFPGFISTIGAPNGSLDNGNCVAPEIQIGNRCRYNPAAQHGVNSIPDTKQLNLFGSGRYQINADWQAYITGLYSQQQTQFQIQPTPLSDQVPTTATPTGAATITLQPTSPFYPTQLAADNGVGGQPLNIRYRCVVCGFRNTTDNNDAWQVVAGAKGTAWNWDFDGSFNYSANTAKEKVNNGFFQYTQIDALLSSGVVNMFGPNTDAVQQQVDALSVRRQLISSKLSGYGVDLTGSGDIYKLPAGPLALALGLQAGKQTLTENFDPLIVIGDMTGYGGNLGDISHSRTEWAVFGELNIPILKNLEANMAVRYDHYSDVGSTTNPKFSLRYQPVQQLLLRASYGTGFLAPSLYELWNPAAPGLSQPGVSDPLRCPDPNGPGSENNPDCNTQFTATFGGSPNLKPQEANQTTVGFVWEPLNGASIGADWFYINLKDLVTNGVPIATILSPATYSQFSSLVTRAATCAGGQPCPITAIDQRFINIAKEKIQGIDVDARFTSPNTDLGRFRALITGTYYIQYLASLPGGGFGGFVSNAYAAPATGITPRWKSYAALTWDYGPWTATLGNTYQSSYVDVTTDGDGNLRRVGSLSLWDIQGSYTGFKDWTLTLGAKNVFDTNPPFTNSFLTFQSGYDPSYYDARARVVYGSVRWTWK